MNKQFWIFTIWYRIILREGLKKKGHFFLNVQPTEPLCLQKYALRLFAQYKTVQVLLQVFFLILGYPSQIWQTVFNFIVA